MSLLNKIVKGFGFHRFIQSRLHAQRSIKRVPPIVRFGIGIVLCGQIALQQLKPPIQSQVDELPQPPSVELMMLSGLGERIPVFYSMLLWLQAFDNQPGVSIPYAQLNYSHLVLWLNRIVQLHPEGNYPFLLASRVYSRVNDSERKRQMLKFINDQFDQAPNQRWRWLAEASLIAKHDLEDMPLALSYAERVSALATAPSVPYWAKDMHWVLLADMNQIESAKLLIGGLLESGQITDPYELNFLQSRLKEMTESSRDE